MTKIMLNKIIPLIFFYLILTAGTSRAQAIMDFQETTYDFGEIEEGTVAEHEFIFTNNGNQALLLSSVKASCGCTTPSWTREPVLPGKTGHVKASYNSKNRPGGFNKTITITSNASKATQVLYIKGTAVKLAQLTPLFTEEELQRSPRAEIIQPHLQLGKVQLGSSIPVQLTIMNTGKTDLEIKGIHSGCRCLSLMPGGNLVIEPDSQAKLELVFTPQSLGEFTYGAQILSNDLVQPKYQVYLTSTTVPRQDQSSVVKEQPSKISF